MLSTMRSPGAKAIFLAGICDTFQQLIAFVAGDIAIRNEVVRALRDARRGVIECRLSEVVDGDLVAVAREDLRHGIAHRSRAGNHDALDILNLHS